MNMSRRRRSAIETRPVLLGPVTFLKLGKSKDPALDPLSLLANLLPVYVDVLRRLKANGAEWVQIDEPCLVLDLDDATRQALRAAYGMFAHASPRAEAHADLYFGGLGDNLAMRSLSRSPASISISCVRPEQLDAVLARAPRGLVLSLGVIDGRNVWRANIPSILDRLAPVVAKRGSDHIRDCVILFAAARSDRP